MKQPFEWFHNLYYGEKSSLSAFDTKNPKSLDALLKKIYMIGRKHVNLRMKNSLPAFNAAYYVAVCLANTEGIDETNFDDEINDAIRTIWTEDYDRHHQGDEPYISFAELMLIKWMVYAILSRQKSMSDDMEFFLQEFRDKLITAVMNEDLFNSGEENKLAFLLEIAEVIDDWKYRYHTDLHPHPLDPKYYSIFTWVNQVRLYTLEELEAQISFFPTQDEQMAFLNWARDAVKHSMPKENSYATSDVESLPF